MYAFTGPDITDEQLFKLEPKVASVAVKAPRDPNQTVEEDESAEDVEPPEGAGLDQGAKASVEESVDGGVADPPAADCGQKPRRAPAADQTPQPLLGPPPVVLSRTYVAVGVSTSGRKGPMSRRVLVPLMAPPPPPSPPVIKYDEKAITVTWTPPAGIAQLQEPATGATAGDDSSAAVALPRHVYDVCERRCAVQRFGPRRRADARIDAIADAVHAA